MIPRKVIINAAHSVGFDLVGVVPAEALVYERNIFDEWLLAGCQSTLGYMERNVEKRFNVGRLVEGAQSLIICAVSYLSPYGRGYDSACQSKIASYALAADYHLTVKSMLLQLAEQLQCLAPSMRFRTFTDTAPLAEKSYAQRAGLGWIGRNSLLVNPKYGSMMHLGELVISEVVDQYDVPMSGVGCGTCRACVEACPNGAIRDNRTIDTRRCVSCRTIEREAEGDTTPLHGWIFGCDACQTVCPFNRHAPQHTNRLFDPIVDPSALGVEALAAMSEERFSEVAGATAMMRAGLVRLRRNALRNTEEEDVR